MKKKSQYYKLFLILTVFLTGIVALNLTSGNQKLFAADSCTPPATTYGTDVMNNVSIPATSTYDIWVRMMVPSTTSNSILLTIANGSTTTCFNVGGSTSIPANTWTWVDYSDGVTATPNAVSLTQGTDTFTLTGTNAGVSVDRIEALVPGASCLPPTGTGDNCTPAITNPPTVSLTAPSNGGTVSGTTNVTATASETGGTISSVQFKLDGANLGSADTTSPYSTSWNTTTASNGSHTLTAVATDSTGVTTTSSTVNVTVSNGTTAVKPSVPTGLSVVNTSNTFTTFNSIPLTWTASTDSGGPGVGGYYIYRNGVQVGTSTTNSWTDTTTGLQPGISYSYTVAAHDTATTPQVSSQSSPALNASTNIIGDIDGDGSVTAHDLSILITHYGTNYPPAEFDLSNTVEAHDLSILITNYGK